MDNRPRSRQTNVTGSGSVQRRGSGLGSGPAGSGGRGGRGTSGGSGNRYSGGNRAGGGLSPIVTIILVVLALLGGGGGGMAALLGGGDEEPVAQYGQPNVSVSSQPGNGNISGSSSSGWSESSNSGTVDTSVAEGAREKRTAILGNGEDQVTVLVYMCGTDLESRSGMASSDLREMAEATLSDKVNVIVYTGGCTAWKTNGISNRVNQIYQVKSGGLRVLKDDAGTGAMTDPKTLTEFIKWGTANYPANRTELILWDHGGGSLSGFGYDEKNKYSGSMDLSGINKALKDAGTTFDFVGFDACLMATVETALMLNNYADYLIASEETEPGIGWYYTNWLTKLSANPSMSTLEVGKIIVDDFVNTCDRKCNGQKTTLSVVDLAELSATVPSKLSAFAKDTSEQIRGDGFKHVSNARYTTREFAVSSKIDQIDLVHFATQVGSKEGKELSEAILGAVKYNKTSYNMTNAYGLSIYFPYKKASKVDSAVNAYKNIGMDDDYSRCIQQFASMEVSGQAAAGGSNTASPLFNLLGQGTSATSSSTSGSDAIFQLLGSMMGGQTGIDGLDSSNTSFFTGKSLDTQQMADYISDNQFDASNLYWSTNANNQQVLTLSEEQWSLVHDLCLSVYYDDGEGYVDLGLDNVFQFDENGSLIGDTAGTWLAINGQVVPYYYESTIEDGDNYSINGYVPALLNGERVELKLVFDNANPYGYIAGAVNVYDAEETETIAKSMIELEVGDTLDFICDFYDYDGTYQDSYFLGEQMVVTDNMEISNVTLDKENMSVMYRFTDIYEQIYWTPVLN